VIRLSVTSGIGRQLAPSYGVRAVPTLILVDGTGQRNLVQVGRVQRESMLAAVSELLN
jgi:thioredoxin-related protein